MPDEYLLKICIIGSPDKLKTTMARIFIEGKFTQDYLPTLGVAITTKQIHINNYDVRLILVDTSGKEFFGKDRPSYHRGASAAIITLDKGDRDSFKAVRSWYKEFLNEINRLKRSRYQVPIALVGFITKSEPKVDIAALKIQKRLKNTDWINWGDIEARDDDEEIDEEVTTAEGQSLAEELGPSYYETRPTDKEISGQIFHELSLRVLGYKRMFNAY